MAEILIETARLTLSRLTLGDARELQAYYVANAAHLDPWEPQRSADFHHLSACSARIAAGLVEVEAGRAVKLVLRAKESVALVGVCNFNTIVRGPFQACTLGYSIAASAQGQGLMFEALTAAIAYMFDTENLHRVMANYIPENTRSGALLTRLGFEIEGKAQKYHHIGGQWRDHILTAKINPNPMSS
jgi:ribosomal-protein-alanine N-acetyltransferase